jgi:hypothetical protein
LSTSITATDCARETWLAAQAGASGRAHRLGQTVDQLLELLGTQFIEGDLARHLSQDGVPRRGDR